MDNDLDEFFAKKDKSRKKVKGHAGKTSVLSVSPVANTETSTPRVDPNVGLSPMDDGIVTASDAVSVDTVKEKKPKSKKIKDAQDLEDDDWDVIDNRVDYSGLKIAAKDIARENKKANIRAARLAAEEAASQKLNMAGKTWAKPEEAPQPIQPTAETKPDAQLPHVSSGRYVPPSQRGGAPELLPMSMKRQTGRGRTAPNLRSSQDFPTLGGGPIPESGTSTFGAVSDQKVNKLYVPPLPVIIWLII